MKVLTENNEEFAIKDLIESDYDDMPHAIGGKEELEEISFNEKDEVSEALFEDTENADIDEFEFNSKDLFDDEDGDIDTTIPDGDFLDDDFGDDDKE